MVITNINYFISTLLPSLCNFKPNSYQKEIFEDLIINFLKEWNFSSEDIFNEKFELFIKEDFNKIDKLIGNFPTIVIPTQEIKEINSFIKQTIDLTTDYYYDIIKQNTNVKINKQEVQYCIIDFLIILISESYTNVFSEIPEPECISHYTSSGYEYECGYEDEEGYLIKETDLLELYEYCVEGKNNVNYLIDMLENLLHNLKKEI